MERLVTYTEEEWKNLSSAITKKIIQVAAKNYGVKFIERETGEESNPMAVFGLFSDAIQRVLIGEKHVSPDEWEALVDRFEREHPEE